MDEVATRICEHELLRGLQVITSLISASDSAIISLQSFVLHTSQCHFTLMLSFLQLHVQSEMSRKAEMA